MTKITFLKNVVDFWPFLEFLRKSQLFWKLQKWEFPDNVLLFFYCLKVSKLEPKVKILQLLIFFMVLKSFLSWCFTKHIFGVFHYFSHHGQAAFFFAPSLLSVQYMNLTIRCVSWDYLMSVMKHFAVTTSKLVPKVTVWEVMYYHIGLYFAHR